MCAEKLAIKFDLPVADAPISRAMEQKTDGDLFSPPYCFHLRLLPDLDDRFTRIIDPARLVAAELRRIIRNPGESWQQVYIDY